MRLLLIFAVFYFGKAHAQTTSGIFTKQRQSLHSFAVRASKAKSLVALLDQSNLRWQKGFAELRETVKNIHAVPKVLSTQKGIEIVSEGQKISVQATGRAFSFLLNEQEIVVDTPVDLKILTAKINKVLEGKKTVQVSFFSRAEALAFLVAPWATPIITAAGAEFLYLYFSWFTSSAHSIKCELDGSFEIYSSEDPRPDSPIFKYKKGVSQYRIDDQLRPEKDVFDLIKKKLITDGEQDVEGALEKTKIVIETEIKARFEECKGKEAWLNSWGKSSLEKMVEGGISRPMRPSSK